MLCPTTLPSANAPAVSSVPTSRVKIENPLESTNWDERVSRLPGCNIFHSAAWCKVLHGSYGFTPLYFTSTHDGQLDGVLPVMEVNSWLTGTRGVSLPFTDHCQPIGFSTSLVRPLLKAVLKHGSARRWRYLECRSEAAWAGSLSNCRSSLSFRGHKLELTWDTDSIFARFDSSVRRAIRKAEKAGLVVEVSRDLAAVRSYYELHCKTRKKHGLPPQPFKFFLNIHRFILSQQMGMVVSAKLNGKAIASAVCLHFGTDAVYKFGASDDAFQDLRPNNLVLWEAIKWFARAGAKVLDFGRTSLYSEGLRRYKLGWGTDEQKINYYKFDLWRDAFVTDRDAVCGWHNRVFRALPGWLAKLSGAAVYRHLA